MHQPTVASSSAKPRKQQLPSTYDVLASPTPIVAPKPYPREELEEMCERWMEANRQAEATGDWVSTLGALYHEDAAYRWNIGPGEEFVAVGLEEIHQNALGVQMDGFHGWNYPYDRLLIDDQKGEVVGFWRQRAPIQRPDGTVYEVAGCGGSWFQYGGDFKWSWQRDFFDLGNVFAIMAEMAAADGLSAPIKSKIRTMARGQKLAGHVELRPKGGMGSKLRQGAALAKIALLGR